MILGDVNYIGAGATDSLTINAGNRIELNTDTGLVSMTDIIGITPEHCRSTPTTSGSATARCSRRSRRT